MPGSSTSAIKRPRFFARDRCGLLRLTPFASRLTGSAPTVFDGPGCPNHEHRVPKFFTERSQVSLVRLKSLLGDQASLVHSHPRPHGAGDRDFL